MTEASSLNVCNPKPIAPTPPLRTVFVSEFVVFLNWTDIPRLAVAVTLPATPEFPGTIPELPRAERLRVTMIGSEMSKRIESRDVPAMDAEPPAVSVEDVVEASPLEFRTTPL